jgi:hypothetical protein
LEAEQGSVPPVASPESKKPEVAIINRLLLAAPLAAGLLASCGPKAIALPEDPIERAATCSVVAAANAREASKSLGSLSFDDQAHVMHYALLAGSDSGAFDQERAARAAAKAQQVQESVTDAKWQDLVAPCAAAYPAAQPKPAVTLPADAFDAQMGCYTLASFLAKTMGGDPAVEEKLVEYGALNRKLDPRIGATLAARGVKTDSDQAKQLRNEALARTAKLGPLGTVLAACKARFG